jgi:O-antigen/teichoic acid export membrane protein
MPEASNASGHGVCQGIRHVTLCVSNSSLKYEDSPLIPDLVRSLFRNIAGSWFGIGADAITGLILTRLILHAVGAESFGLWVLASGLLGYYGLLDMGTRNGIIRYVARHNAQKDFTSLSSVVSTALAGYLAIGAAVLVLSLSAAWRLDHLFAFHTARELYEGRVLVITLGVGAAVGFPLSAFGGTLEGLEQFVQIGVVQATASVTRAIAVVIALQLGYGIVAVGVLTVAFNVAAGLFNAVYVVRHVPQLTFARQGVRRDTLRTLAGFGLVTFWVAVANRLRFESDSFVIGRMIGLDMIAVFAIGARIIAYTTEVVAAMASVFTPALSSAHAVGDRERVASMTLTGNHLSSVLAFPFCAVLIFFGRQLISLWVGAQYEASYGVLVILCVPMSLYISQFGSTRMLYGVGQHRTLARILFAEGAANLALSIALAPRYGIRGVAMGTAIPLAATALVVLPMISCRAIGSSISRYWSTAQLPALVAVLPLVAFFALARTVWPEPGIMEALFQLAAGGALYAALVYRTFRKPHPVPAS